LNGEDGSSVKLFQVKNSAIYDFVFDNKSTKVYAAGYKHDQKASKLKGFFCCWSLESGKLLFEKDLGDSLPRTMDIDSKNQHLVLGGYLVTKTTTNGVVHGKESAFHSVWDLKLNAEKSRVDTKNYYATFLVKLAKNNKLVTFTYPNRTDEKSLLYFYSHFSAKEPSAPVVSAKELSDMIEYETPPYIEFSADNSKMLFTQGGIQALFKVPSSDADSPHKKPAKPSDFIVKGHATELMGGFKNYNSSSKKINVDLDNKDLVIVLLFRDSRTKDPKKVIIESIFIDKAPAKVIKTIDVPSKHEVEKLVLISLKDFVAHKHKYQLKFKVNGESIELELSNHAAPRLKKPKKLFFVINCRSR